MKLDPSLPQSFLNVDPSSPLASATSPAGSSGFFLSPCRSPDLRVPRVYPRVANLLTFRVRSFWPFWIACPYPCLWSVPSFVVCIKGINDFGIDSDLFHESLSGSRQGSFPPTSALTGRWFRWNVCLGVLFLPFNT